MQMLSVPLFHIYGRLTSNIRRTTISIISLFTYVKQPVTLHYSTIKLNKTKHLFYINTLKSSSQFEKATFKCRKFNNRFYLPHILFCFLFICLFFVLFFMIIAKETYKLIIDHISFLTTPNSNCLTEHVIHSGEAEHSNWS